MNTFYFSLWAGRGRGCYARSSHSSIVFCLLTSFCCLIPRAFLGNSDYALWLVVFCMVHGVRGFKVCLFSWTPFQHVCMSCLKVSKVRGIGGGFWEGQGAYSLFSEEFHPTITRFLWNMKDPGKFLIKRHWFAIFRHYQHNIRNTL